MISYAQNHEDVLLRRAFVGQRDGFYIDVGAHDPVFDSVTKHFSDCGWRGVNVEPIPRKAAAFASARPRDVNLAVGLSDRAGRTTFYEVVEAPTVSTFSAELADGYRGDGYTVAEHQVEVLTLADVCEQYAPSAIDFLSLDVEGHERLVLSGVDFRRWRPRVVVVEATRPGCQAPAHHEWEGLLLSADYRFAIFDGLNRYYVRGEEPELIARLAVPANVFDNYTPYAQHQLEQELKRYRTLNPVRRLVRWVLDVRTGVPRKLRSVSSSRRASTPAASQTESKFAEDRDALACGGDMIQSMQGVPTPVRGE
ncbi:MAG TPA: FkbM family methyltransferase [Fimbriiglobus sp.]|nr:FkbM family methyltransferase [Fimbriiglobus sp.]